MERNELFSLVRNGLCPQVSASFSAEDANNAAINAILEHFGLSADASYREVKPYMNAIYALIEEAIDIELPKKLENVMGAFAEIKSFARDAEIVFKASNKIGQRRAKLTIQKGARNGIYKAARFDNQYFSIDVSTWTVAWYVTLEDLILGKASLAELFANVLEGFEEKIYLETVAALESGHTSVTPAANRFTVDGSTVTMGSALDDAIEIIKAYGNPLIIGFSKELGKINNVTTVGTPTRSAEDLSDIRNNGFVQVYKGVKLVEIPNYLKDNTNTQWYLNTQYLYVVASDAKPVKVALKGDMVIVENTQPTGSKKVEANKEVGVALLMAENLCVIKDTQA